MRKRRLLLLLCFLSFPCSVAYAGFGETLFQQWFIQPIQSFLITLIQTSIGGIANWISEPTDLYKYEFVAISIEAAQSIGFSLLVVNVMKEVLQTILSHSCGEGGKPVIRILIDTIKSALLIGLSTWILQMLLSINNRLVRVITESGNFSLTKVGQTTFDQMIGTENALRAGTGSFLLMAIVVFLFGLGLLILAIMAAFRYSQLIILAVLAPILAVSIASKKEAYHIWIRESVAVVFTQAFQYWLLWGLMTVLMKDTLLRSMFDVTHFWNVLVVIGLLLATIIAPSVLKKYLHNSGVGGIAVNTAKFAVYRALMRR